MPSPKWRLDYTLEVLNYLEDNGRYAADILQGIKMLRYIEDGLPPEGAVEMRGLIHWYTIYHLVIYKKQDGVLKIDTIIPD